MHHSTSREKTDPKGGPEIIRAACLFSKRRTTASLLTGLVTLPKAVGIEPQAGTCAWQSCGVRTSPPVGLEGGPSPRGLGGQRIQLKGITPKSRELMKFALLGFGLAWDLSPFPSSPFLLEWGCLSSYCPSSVFWKHVSWFVFTGLQLETNFASG